MIILLEDLTLKNCIYIDTTVLDTYTVMGRLPEDKENMLSALYALAGSISPRDERNLRLREMPGEDKLTYLS